MGIQYPVTPLLVSSGLIFLREFRVKPILNLFTLDQWSFSEEVSSGSVGFLRRNLVDINFY
jgi:hypothetical protein